MNLYFPQIFLVRHQLDKALQGDDLFMYSMAHQMTSKFDKYWLKHSVILAIAVILDPRYKLKFVEWSYTVIYGEKSLEMAQVKEKFDNLFGTYTSLHCSSDIGEQNTSLEDDLIVSQECVDLFKGFDTYVGGELSSATKQTKFYLYCGESTMDRHQELDIIDYWKGNSLRFLILSMIARDVLAIPLTTIASESAFSVGSSVIDKWRSPLSHESVDALICTQDWLYGKIEDLAPELDDLVHVVLA